MSDSFNGSKCQGSSRLAFSQSDISSISKLGASKSCILMMPCNPGLIRKIWNEEDYIDQFFKMALIPISKDYALSLIDMLMVHHVLGLLTQADKMAEKS